MTTSMISPETKVLPVDAGYLSEHEEDSRVRRTRGGRALRNNKHKIAFRETRCSKRLFTPEIKKFLKGWLIRKRKNPYPNRSEKKDLALKTGLTYMQICNWFANWRRKLKKSSREGESGLSGTWGRLITSYNRQAQARGNVEHISISSEDSIWDETNYNHSGTAYEFLESKTSQGTTLSYSTSSPSPESTPPIIPWTTLSLHTPDVEDSWRQDKTPVSTPAPALLKWLESAARFRPRQVRWGPPPLSWPCSSSHSKRFKSRPSMRGRHREELDAAEALTFLSRSYRGQCV